MAPIPTIHVSGNFKSTISNAVVSVESDGSSGSYAMFKNCSPTNVRATFTPKAGFMVDESTTALTYDTSSGEMRVVRVKTADSTELAAGTEAFTVSLIDEEKVDPTTIDATINGLTFPTSTYTVVGDYIKVMTSSGNTFSVTKNTTDYDKIQTIFYDDSGEISRGTSTGGITMASGAKYVELHFMRSNPKELLFIDHPTVQVVRKDQLLFL